MDDDGVVFKLGEEDGDDGDDDHGGKDGAECGKDASPEAFEFEAYECGDVDGDHAWGDLADGVVVHEVVFGRPVAVFDDFSLENRQDGVASAEGDGAAFGKDKEKFEQKFHFDRSFLTGRCCALFLILV